MLKPRHQMAVLQIQLLHSCHHLCMYLIHLLVAGIIHLQVAEWASHLTVTRIESLGEVIKVIFTGKIQ